MTETRIRKAVGPEFLPADKNPIALGRLRLIYRNFRYLFRSMLARQTNAIGDAAATLAILFRLSLGDLFGASRVECNICGWRGKSFYPNTGAGFFETETLCPGCHCINRYRTIAAILNSATEFFSPEKSVIEVAPVRSFQAYALWRKNGRNYLSFDPENFGLEKGDLTDMQYPDESCDYFLCIHVLEHILDDDRALGEIYRVLKPDGVGILQVPFDHMLTETVEYGKPDPLETGHVRRYAERGFREKLLAHGFRITVVGTGDLFPEKDSAGYGFDRAPLYLVRRSV